MGLEETVRMKYMVCVDNVENRLSSSAKHTIEFVVKNLLRDEDEMIVFTATPTIGDYLFHAVTINRAQERENKEKEVHQILQTAVALAKEFNNQANVHGKLGVGDDCRATICSAARDQNVDLVVCGRRSRKFGSFSNYIVEHCYCPVLVVQ